jgi:hypothetical protein
MAVSKFQWFRVTYNCRPFQSFFFHSFLSKFLLMAVFTKITVFSDKTPFRLVEVYRIPAERAASIFREEE